MEATGVVVTAKLAEVVPAATVTLAGAWATAVLLVDRVTTAPPVGAGLVRVTDPFTDVPPFTEVGLRVMVLSTDEVTVKPALWVEP